MNSELGELREAYMVLVKRWRDSLKKGEVHKAYLSEREEERLRSLGYAGD